MKDPRQVYAANRATQEQLSRAYEGSIFSRKVVYGDLTMKHGTFSAEHLRIHRQMGENTRKLK